MTNKKNISIKKKILSLNDNHIKNEHNTIMSGSTYVKGLSSTHRRSHPC